MRNKITVTTTHLLSETESAGAVYRNYVRLTHESNTHRPLQLQITETFSKAKNPDEHRVRFSLNFEDQAAADRFADIITNHL